MVIQDSKLLFAFRIIITISFILIRKRVSYVITISRLSRHFQDVFKTVQDVSKTSSKTRNFMSWKTRNCYAEDVFKTSWRPTNFCWENTEAYLGSCQVSIVEFFAKIANPSRHLHYISFHLHFKVNNRNTITKCEICSKLTIKTP